MTISDTTRAILEQQHMETIDTRSRLDVQRAHIEQELHAVLGQLGVLDHRVIELERDLGIAPADEPEAPEDDGLEGAHRLAQRAAQHEAAGIAPEDAYAIASSEQLREQGDGS